MQLEKCAQRRTQVGRARQECATDQYEVDLYAASLIQMRVKVLPLAGTLAEELVQRQRFETPEGEDALNHPAHPLRMCHSGVPTSRRRRLAGVEWHIARGP